ncbi:hypothetical protein N7474_007970 [Penicillium riverlandense]|uniref:uncharacterized protein n=1 Tax=Penicillium riverlandense TaxID=1903569 RepID=UPI002546BA58|nr:uncharacterized protein N7474_007970 [Penicillium riverlandense]KAJ5811669.1 hypothetical protein N7474_007970 [Penicillium riverlandense]
MRCSIIAITFAAAVAVAAPGAKPGGSTSDIESAASSISKDFIPQSADGAANSDSLVTVDKRGEDLDIKSLLSALSKILGKPVEELVESLGL